MNKKIFYPLTVASLILAMTGCTLLDESLFSDDEITVIDPAKQTEETASNEQTGNASGEQSSINDDYTDSSWYDSSIWDEDNTSSASDNSVSSDSTDTASDNDGSASGSFYTVDIYGNPVNQSVFTNANINFVNVWGTFCGPCLQEMPDLGALAKEYDPEEVQFIGIVCDVNDLDGTDTAIYYVEQTGADYTHLICNEDIYYWGVGDMQYVPTTLIIDSYGNILDEYVGSRSKKEWNDIIQSFLN